MTVRPHVLAGEPEAVAVPIGARWQIEARGALLGTGRTEEAAWDQQISGII